jgi:hypothetical protein
MDFSFMTSVLRLLKSMSPETAAGDSLGADLASHG